MKFCPTLLALVLVAGCLETSCESQAERRKRRLAQRLDEAKVKYESVRAHSDSYQVVHGATCSTVFLTNPTDEQLEMLARVQNAGMRWDDIVVNTDGSWSLTFDRVYPDVEILRTLPLHRLALYVPPVRDLTPFASLDLQELEVLGSWSAERSDWVTDLSPVKEMRDLRRLSVKRTSLRDLSPLKDLVGLRDLQIDNTDVTDLTLLKNLTGLRELRIARMDVSSLEPIAGMEQLQHLSIAVTKVRDLSPLVNLKRLRILQAAKTPVSDVSPLNGLPLELLDIRWTDVIDLTPLEGMSLECLGFTPHSITKGLDIVRQMRSLTSIVATKSWDFVPAKEFWQRYDAGEFYEKDAERPPD